MDALRQAILDALIQSGQFTPEMLEALQKGDEVVTAGGMLGRIAKLGEQYVTVEIAPNTEITVQRAAIAQLLPKRTIKAL